MSAVLCLGGLDPAGRAGLLADARAVTAMGARPLCVATALTFQSSRGARGYAAVEAEVVLAQLAPLLEDETIGAVKLGQLASKQTARALAEALPDVPLVVDTPVVASSGAPLFPLDALDAYEPLFARAALVTPNAPEVELFAGPGDLEASARGLARNVLLKGGHLPGGEVRDVLFAKTERLVYSSPRVPGRFRGTGCRLASAVAARLAQGDPVPDAVGTARAWLVSELSRER